MCCNNASFFNRASLRAISRNNFNSTNGNIYSALCSSQDTVSVHRLLPQYAANVFLVDGAISQMPKNAFVGCAVSSWLFNFR